MDEFVSLLRCLRDTLATTERLIAALQSGRGSVAEGRIELRPDDELASESRALLRLFGDYPTTVTSVVGRMAPRNPAGSARDAVPGIDTHPQDVTAETLALLRLFGDRLATAEQLLRFYRLSESFVEDMYERTLAQR